MSNQLCLEKSSIVKFRLLFLRFLLPVSLSFVCSVSWARTSADIIAMCGHDDVNDAMETLKWSPPDAAGNRHTKGWQTLNDSPELASWYSQNPFAPNIYRFNLAHGRSLTQSPGGLKVGFWLANANNVAFFAPQVMDILKSVASDAIVIRAHQNPSLTFNYAFYASGTTANTTSVSKPVDFRNLYREVATKTTDNSGNPRIVLGYDFTTKAVTPDKTGVAASNQSTLTDGLFAKFVMNPSAAEIRASQLAPEDYLTSDEYLLDPASAGAKPLRNCIDAGCSTYNDDVYWVNFANPAAADKVANRAKRFFNEGFGLAGMATDGTFYDPTFSSKLVIPTATMNQSNSRFLCEYRAGIRAKQVQNAKSFFTLYNLLEPAGMETLNSKRDSVGLSKISVTTWRRKTEQLLQYSHGGLLEFFGGFQDDADPLKAPCRSTTLENETCDPKTNFYKRNFSLLLDAIREWRRNPEKIFIVAARGPKNYESYADDFAWQEYLYGVYLLGSGSNTAFKYLSLFQFPTSAVGVRSDGLQLYDNQMLKLGNPKPQFDENGAPTFKVSQTDGISWRQFDNALVMVNPLGASAAASTKNLKSLAPAGLNWATVPTLLLPGQSYIAMKTARVTGAGRILDFSDSAVSSFYAQNETMEVASASLRVKETIPASLTDILLNPVKYKSHGGSVKLDLTVNGNRPNNRVISMVAEVDDERTAAADLPLRRNRVLYELWMGPLPAGMKTVDVAARPSFREKQPSAEQIPVIRIANANNGTFGSPTTIQFGPQDRLNANNLGYIKFRRWELMRMSGDYSLRHLQIGDGDYIISPNGL
jgi:hypothetical protein